MCMCVIVWNKGSLTASNSLSSGSCCGVGAWWPIPPAPYFSFNDAQINSSTLFQNSSSQLILCPLGILTSTPPFQSGHQAQLVWKFVPTGRFATHFLALPSITSICLLQLFLYIAPDVSLSTSLSLSFSPFINCLFTVQQLNFTFLLSLIQQKSDPRLCERYLCVWHACTFVLMVWNTHLLFPL